MFIKARDKLDYECWINTKFIEEISPKSDYAYASIDGSIYIISKEDCDKLLKGDRYDTD